MNEDTLKQRLSEEYVPGSFGAEIARLHRDAERLAGRKVADMMAEECFSRLDRARDEGLRRLFTDELV